MGLKETLGLRLFGWLKIPMLGYLRPRVVTLVEDRVEIEVPLFRHTRNHLGAMYFGALSAGADCAAGLIAMRMIEKSGQNVSLVFKDFKAEFLKRAEGDVRFVCTQGREISELVLKTLQSPDRQELPVAVIATVPSKLGEEPVARFVLTLSLKRR